MHTNDTLLFEVFYTVSKGSELLRGWKYSDKTH